VKNTFPESLYRLNPNVAIEDFGSKSLVLHCIDLRFIELNATARHLISRLDGQPLTLNQIAASLTEDYDQSLETATEDVEASIQQLVELNVIEKTDPETRKEHRHEITTALDYSYGENEMAKDVKRYIVNPDVSCREEGPDGALLFNPDTDQVLVINTTGTVIWHILAKPCSQDRVIAVLGERCRNVPEDQIAQDVTEFLERLIAKGFVGIYEGDVD
jgi:hypothetical protein